MVTLPKVDPKAFLIRKKFEELGLKYKESHPREAAFYYGNDLSSRSIPSKARSKGNASGASGKILTGVEQAAALKEVKKYKAELDKLSEAELCDLYAAELERHKAKEEQERFYHQPYADADFDYWSKMAHWSLEEAVALSFGKSPKVVNKKSLSTITAWSSPFVREYENTLELAQRAIPWKKLFDPVLPPIFVKWAQHNDIPMPKELIEKVEARSANFVDWEKLYKDLSQSIKVEREETLQTLAAKNKQIEKLFAENVVLQEQTQQVEVKPLRTREKESLLKLVIGMAVGFYGFDPDAKRSPTPREIASDLELRGIHLDVDTVRKWLKEASDLLPELQDDEPG